jgi:putative sigma-54 modulation protein
MQTSVTFKNLDPTDTLKSYVRDKLDRFDRYLDNPAEANVVLLVEKFRHIAEININGDRLTINGKEETNDMYSNIALMEADINLPEEELVREVKVKNIEYKPMDVEEAVLQMDLLSNSFLVFTNARSDRVNVLYRRKDGHYGLIQPNG